MAIPAIIALVAQFAPLIPLVKTLITQAETTLPSVPGEPKPGPDRKELVVSAVKPFAKILKDKGILPDSVDEEAVGTIIEVVLSLMKTDPTSPVSKPVDEDSLVTGMKKNTAYPAIFEGTVKLKV